MASEWSLSDGAASSILQALEALPRGPERAAVFLRDTPPREPGAPAVVVVFDASGAVAAQGEAVVAALAGAGAWRFTAEGEALDVVAPLEGRTVDAWRAWLASLPRADRPELRACGFWPPHEGNPWHAAGPASGLRLVLALAGGAEPVGDAA